MLYKRFFFLLACSFIFITISRAQQVELTLHLQNQQGQALEKAVVLLQDPAGKTIKAALSGKDGLATLRADTGKYIVHISYSGLEAISDTAYFPAAGNQTRSYTLLPKNLQLEAVRVIAQKKLISTRDDLFIYNVAADSMARSMSVSQVLGNVPFITVDGTGNVQVAGQGNYKILVNGKETALFAANVSQALKSFPADMVLRIELNLSPGAKYDAEGITAIINIITKKKFEGYKGYAVAYISDRSHFSDGLTLTARTGRLGITAMGQADGNFNALNSYTTTTTTPLIPSAFKNREVIGGEAVKRSAGSGTIELNYEIDSIHSLTGYATLGKRSVNNRSDQQVATILSDNITENGAIQMQSSDRTPSTMAGLDYSVRSKSNPAKEISLRFNWQGSDNRLANTTAQQFDSFTKWMQNNSTARNDEFTFQADLVPVAKQKLTVEAGAKVIIRRASAAYTSLFTYGADKEFIKDPTNSNSFNYHQQVYAAYGSANVKAGKNNIRAGLRLEQTNITGLFSNLTSAVKDHYLSVVPNINWSRKLSKDVSLSASYNLNLLRPYITSLNPYINNVDSLNISYGNPSLGPQAIHKLQLQSRYNNEKMFLAASLTGSLSNNKILPYRLFDPATGITSNTIGNAGKEKIASLNISSSYQFSKYFRGGIGGELRYVDIRNKIITTQKNSGYSGLASGFFNWEVSKAFNISGSGGVNVNNVSLIGRYTPVTFYQVNFGYHIVKDKLFATINWNNVDARYITQKTIFSDEAVSSVIASRNIYRVIFLGIQYTFGKLKKEVAQKKAVSNDDLLK
jgi:hypothetical protein